MARRMVDRDLTDKSHTTSTTFNREDITIKAGGVSGGCSIFLATAIHTGTIIQIILSIHITAVIVATVAKHEGVAWESNTTITATPTMTKTTCTTPSSTSTQATRTNTTETPSITGTTTMAAERCTIADLRVGITSK